jgi:hypothetical protein
MSTRPGPGLGFASRTISVIGDGSLKDNFWQRLGAVHFESVDPSPGGSNNLHSIFPACFQIQPYPVTGILIQSRSMEYGCNCVLNGIQSTQFCSSSVYMVESKWLSCNLMLLQAVSQRKFLLRPRTFTDIENGYNSAPLFKEHDSDLGRPT